MMSNIINRKALEAVKNTFATKGFTPEWVTIFAAFPDRIAFATAVPGAGTEIIRGYIGPGKTTIYRQRLAGGDWFQAGEYACLEDALDALDREGKHRFDAALLRKLGAR